MEGIKETRISPRVLTIYKKDSITSLCSFFKHQADIAEKKYTHREEIYII